MLQKLVLQNPSVLCASNFVWKNAMPNKVVDDNSNQIFGENRT